MRGVIRQPAPVKVKILIRRVCNGWNWRLLDSLFREIERGNGCRTYKDAKDAADFAKALCAMSHPQPPPEAQSNLNTNAGVVRLGPWPFVWIRS